MTDAFDVIVIGGGPAGSTLALRLAQLGRRAAIVEKAAFPRHHAGESLTRGVLPLFDALGLRGKTDAAGFSATRGATIWWAGELIRHEPESAESYLVDRGRFDGVLLDSARESGVRVFQPARVADRAFEDGWSIKLDSGETLTSRYLADAGGRSRVLSGPKAKYGTSTLAICAYWREADACDVDTLGEAGESAWYWGAALPGGDFSAMVFVDPENARAPLYPEFIRNSRLLWPRLRNAACGEVRVCDATAFLDTMPVTLQSVKAGDAALSIDPLSSQGVQTAIGSALHAAVVINTIMDRPGDADIAMDFYRKRLKESAEFHARAAGQFYREQFAVCGNEFWRKRARLEEPRPVTGSVTIHRDLVVRVAEKASFTEVGAVDGRYVVRQDGVELDGRVSVYIGGAKVADLLRSLGGTAMAIEVVERWQRSIPGAQALQTFEWAWAEGLIEKAV